MRRGLAIGGAMLLALCGLLFQSIAFPQPAVACSCAGPPPSLKEIVEQGGGVAVLIGTIGAPLPEMTPITVEAWFHGAAPQGVVWIHGGSQMMSSCDRPLANGQRHLLVLYGRPGEQYSTNVCAPGALLNSPEGQALLAEATALFGSGEPPPTAEPVPAQPFDFSPLTGSGLVSVAVGALAAAAIFGLVALAARRRPLS